MNPKKSQSRSARDIGLRTKENVSERVYVGLIDLIISGQLKPGDTLTERAAAEYLNASRTPVREALNRLDSEGLVTKQVNRGVTISPFSAEGLLQVLNVRKLVEGEAARLAAGNLSTGMITQMRAAAHSVATRDAPSLQEMWEADDLIHAPSQRRLEIPYWRRSSEICAEGLTSLAPTPTPRAARSRTIQITR